MAGTSGLSEIEAAKRLRLEGANELPAAKTRTVWRIALEVIREPMFLLLILGGTIYFVLGDVGEGVMLLGFVIVVMRITLYQERKTERALEALRDLSSPRALVIRDHLPRRIAGSEVVRDDILVLAEGDRVPADALLISDLHLSVDESLLTGESVPVNKLVGAESLEFSRPGGDGTPFLYSGTLIVQGEGLARVQATGARTELGKIGTALQTVNVEPTTLKLETDRLVRLIASGGLVLCVLVVLGYGLIRGHWLDGLLAGIALAMALLPEEIPVILTVFMALGAWRIAQHQVLTRRAQVIETLGSATVLCVDKTGTLTHNHMTVASIATNREHCDVTRSNPKTFPENFHTTLEFGLLASHPGSFDPMECALAEAGDRLLVNTEHLHGDWNLVREYPLSPALLALSHVWRASDGTRYVIATKGAPEAIADLCHLSASDQLEVARTVETMAEDGLRVLGVARAYFQPVVLDPSVLPEIQHDFEFELLGLIGFEDPVRETVPAAIAACRSAGVRVVMITGDHIGTARHIAQRAGLSLEAEAIIGSELEAMNDEELERRVRNTSIFARVVPEQKLRLVNALKKNHEVVAMTGDGVNDAPALRAAHIGVAMGARGTDVAREAASLVLLDDDFSSIVRAVRLGRRIFDNLRKAFVYVTAIHVPIAGISLLPVLAGWPLILQPAHIVFLELIIDPACSIVFEAEPEEDDVMRRPPRGLEQPIFDRRTIGMGLAQGLGVLLVTLGVFAWTLTRDRDEPEIRAMVFVTLIAANLGLILSNRSWSRSTLSSLRVRNPALWWVMGAAVTFLTLVLSVPLLRDLFGFATLHLEDLGLCLGAGIVCLGWFELLKFWLRSRGPGDQGSVTLQALPDRG